MSVSIGGRAFNVQDVASRMPGWRAELQEGGVLLRRTIMGNDANPREFEAVGQAVRVCKARRLDAETLRREVKNDDPPDEVEAITGMIVQHEDSIKATLKVEFEFTAFEECLEYLVPFGHIVECGGVVISASADPVRASAAVKRRREAPHKSRLDLEEESLDSVVVPGEFFMMGWTVTDKELTLITCGPGGQLTVDWPPYDVISSVRVGPNVYSNHGGTVERTLGEYTETISTNQPVGVLHTDGQNLFLVEGNVLHYFDNGKFVPERDDLPQHDFLAMWPAGICCIMRNVAYTTERLSSTWTRTAIDPAFKVKALFATPGGPRVLTLKIPRILAMHELRSDWVLVDEKCLDEDDITSHHWPGPWLRVYYDPRSDTTHVYGGCVTTFGPYEWRREPRLSSRSVLVTTW
jgi:hypothetical protein